MEEEGSPQQENDMQEENVDVAQVLLETEVWADEVTKAFHQEHKFEDEVEWASDDVNGGVLLVKREKTARREETVYMEHRKIWHLVPIQESWDKTGKAPVSMRWVDTDKNKGIGEVMDIRPDL